MFCWMIPECVEGIKLGDDNPAYFVLNFFGISFKKWIGIVMMLLLISLIIWFICLDVNEDFEDPPIEIREHFDSEADSLMGQFEILFEIDSRMRYDELLVALRNLFMRVSSKLDDDESSVALCLQKDPERRIAWFFSKVENRIDKLSSSYKCGKDDAGLLYFERLHQLDQSYAEPSPRYLNKLRQINRKGSNTSRHRYLSETKQNVSDAEERLKPIDMNGGIISNLERKFKLNEDDCTEKTAAESLDLSLDTFSINGLVIWHKDWSVVVSDDTLRQIRQIIERKVKRSKKKTRLIQNKNKIITPPVNRIKFIYLSEAMRIFTKIIRLYSSSAFRYAMFRSNRRYKPGD